MTENSTQPNPQFIFWVKKAGVFRPAELKMPENYLGYDLEKNVQLGTQDISPETLDLVASVYMGPINISEESSKHSFGKSTFQRLREYRHGIPCGIVGLAEEVAKEQGAPYFGVTVVRTSKDRTWKFEQRERDLLKEVIIGRKYDLGSVLKEQEEPTEFVLHPTAQLYVPRK